jgi:antitoxin (DNA-binding transcriptional repressor) of toxin-antitoxin stability system
MAIRISSAQAKAQLSALVARVAFAGEHFVIERRGKPMAALVRVEEMERLDDDRGAGRPRGALALIGAWRELEDSEIDEFINDIYRQREGDIGRDVDLED